MMVEKRISGRTDGIMVKLQISDDSLHFLILQSDRPEDSVLLVQAWPHTIVSPSQAGNRMLHAHRVRSCSQLVPWIC